ncbi:hypothetical protein ACQKWADRAFT_306066 [Trichoderma austrokoningii]
MSQSTDIKPQLRSPDPFGRPLREDGSAIAFSRENGDAVYRDDHYQLALETKGCYMHSSASGMVKEDAELCKRLLTTSQPIASDDALFSDDNLDKFLSSLRHRSEARISIDLHPRLVPSVENLYICGREEFAGITEGLDDLWVKAIPFCGPRPQPDHTYGFKPSNFTEHQRRKLVVQPTEKSSYTASEDVYFPFLTAEINQRLDVADRLNMHSMTIHMRGIVDLYRKINRPNDMDGRVLGFSISHDANTVRIHAYYPEINGDETSYWRETLREFDIGSDGGKDKWTCYQFTLNVCQLFALPLVERLKAVIDELSDPLPQPMEQAATPEDASVQGSQDEPGVAEFHDHLYSELRNMIYMLHVQVDRQATEANRQKREAKERETLLLARLQQQQKVSEEQLEEFMERLKEQRERIERVLLEALPAL